jgi:hypothetical protein
MLYASGSQEAHTAPRAHIHTVPQTANVRDAHIMRGIISAEIHIRGSSVCFVHVGRRFGVFDFNLGARVCVFVFIDSIAAGGAAFFIAY